MTLVVFTRDARERGGRPSSRLNSSSGRGLSAPVPQFGKGGVQRPGFAFSVIEMKMLGGGSKTQHEKTESQRLLEILAAPHRDDGLRRRCLGRRRALEREAVSAMGRQRHRTRLLELAVVTRHYGYTHVIADIQQRSPRQDHPRPCQTNPQTPPTTARH